MRSEHMQAEVALLIAALIALTRTGDKVTIK